MSGKLEASLMPNLAGPGALLLLLTAEGSLVLEQPLSSVASWVDKRSLRLSVDVEPNSLMMCLTTGKET